MRKHTCEFCASTFKRLGEYMVHYHKVHEGKVDIRRTVACWSCAGQVHPDAPTCQACGWVRTPMHIHGTQHINNQ